MGEAVGYTIGLAVGEAVSEILGLVMGEGEGETHGLGVGKTITNIKLNSINVIEI